MIGGADLHVAKEQFLSDAFLVTLGWCSIACPSMSLAQASSFWDPIKGKTVDSSVRNAKYRLNVVAQSIETGS